MFKLLIPLLKLFIPSVEIVAPRGARHCLVCLKQPLSKFGLPLLLILPIFESLLPSFSPGGFPRRSPRATFSIAPRLSSSHFLVRALVEPQFCRDPHRWHKLCAPKIWLLGSTSTWAHNLFVLWALGFLLWVVLCLVT